MRVLRFRAFVAGIVSQHTGAGAYPTPNVETRVQPCSSTVRLTVITLQQVSAVLSVSMHIDHSLPTEQHAALTAAY